MCQWDFECASGMQGFASETYVCVCTVPSVCISFILSSYQLHAFSLLSGNAIIERFYYHPLVVDIQSALPDFVIHRSDDKSIGVPSRPKLNLRGLSNRSSGLHLLIYAGNS